MLTPLCLTLPVVLTAQRREYLLPKLSSYRGGYSKEERREIEHALFTHNLLGVAATSALELVPIASPLSPFHLTVPLTGHQHRRAQCDHAFRVPW